MDKKLNLVFDNWDTETNTPINNSNEYFNNKHTSIINVMEFIGYKNYNLLKIEKVEKYPHINFYYIIHNIYLYNVFNTYNFLPINSKIISFLKENKNLYLMFISEQETETISTLKKLDLFLTKLNIDPKKVYIINNNYKLDFLKKKYNLKFNVHTSHSLSLLIKNNNNLFYKKNKNKPLLFLCQNNNSRTHRIALISLLNIFEILIDVDWSLLDDELFINSSTTYNEELLILLNNNFNLYQKTIYFIYDNLSKKCRHEHNINLYKIAFNNSEKYLIKDTFENTYFNIVTETFFFGGDIHITEKSFKPFYCFQFPLFLATHNHVKYMKKNYNFDYFDDIIDHSYDNIVDNSERLFKFVEEIKRIQENKEFFIDFYKNNKHRFLSNYNKAININNDSDIYFFNSLI